MGKLIHVVSTTRNVHKVRQFSFGLMSQRSLTTARLLRSTTNDACKDDRNFRHTKQEKFQMRHDEVSHVGATTTTESALLVVKIKNKFFYFNEKLYSSRAHIS